MEREGRTVNFDYCEVPVQWKPLLEGFRDRITFRIPGEPKPVTLAEWRNTLIERKSKTAR
jgi:hypothetical protein